MINSAEIGIIAVDDEVTLEYEDRVQLGFKSSNFFITSLLENAGEYIRGIATAKISIVLQQETYHVVYFYCLVQSWR